MSNFECEYIKFQLHYPSCSLFRYLDICRFSSRIDFRATRSTDRSTGKKNEERFEVQSKSRQYHANTAQGQFSGDQRFPEVHDLSTNTLRIFFSSYFQGLLILWRIFMQPALEPGFQEPTA